MSRESFDITDQIKSELSGLPLSGSRHNDACEEGQLDHQPPLWVKLTGYRLLNVAVMLVFGMSKAITSQQGGSVVPTTLDLVVGTILALVLYYFGLLQDTRPDLFPLFFQVDLAPAILRFVRCYAVHRFFLSLSPVPSAVALLQLAEKVRGTPGFMIGNRYFARSAESSIIIRNAIMVATMWVFLGTLAALQQFLKVVYRVRALHTFLIQDIVWISLLVVWAMSQSYITSDVVMVEFVPPEPNEYHESLGNGYDFGKIMTIGQVMAIAPIILLYESVEFKNASRFRRLTEGRATLQLFIARLAIMLQFAKIILWGLYLVALIITLARNIKELYYVLHLCVMIIVISHHFLTSLPASWLPTITNAQKTGSSAARSAGSKAWDDSSRIVSEV